jgi:hypothetical protein
MRKIWIQILAGCFTFLIMFGACQQTTEKEVVKSEWLGTNLQEMVENIESQFGGFDQTMIETGYRYKELHWAGVDENWDYALYQLDEMEGSIKKGFARRPAREASAQHFMETALSNLLNVIKDGNQEAFLQEFTAFTASCNTCHALEDVPFMMVKIPEVRTTVIQR